MAHSQVIGVDDQELRGGKVSKKLCNASHGGGQLYTNECNPYQEHGRESALSGLKAISPMSNGTKDLH